MFTEFPHWQFYGYTKVKGYLSGYLNGQLPSNCHLTYSWSEMASLRYGEALLDKGVNTAVAFYDKETLKPIIPSEWCGMPVVNGDVSDLRFNDPKGVIVGLGVKLPKNRKKAVARIEQSNGFFVGV